MWKTRVKDESFEKSQNRLAWRTIYFSRPLHFQTLSLIPLKPPRWKGTLVMLFPYFDMIRIAVPRQDLRIWTIWKIRKQRGTNGELRSLLSILSLLFSYFDIQRNPTFQLVQVNCRNESIKPWLHTNGQISIHPGTFQESIWRKHYKLDCNLFYQVTFLFLQVVLCTI